MKPLKFLSRHSSDLVVYVLIPALTLLLPASFSRALTARIAGWQWLLSHQAGECCRRAAKYTAIEDEREWKTRWRLVVILEVRDLCLLTCGRRRAVFEEISGSEDIELARDKVLVGMHWGPSISILSLLFSRGMRPLMVFRPVEFSIFRHRPWYYLYLAWSGRYIHKTCAERAITIKGAGEALQRELPRSGTSVVLLDAPPTPGRSTIDGVVLGQVVKFNAGFPGILQESGREYLFYALSLHEGNSGLRKLELSAPARLRSQENFIRDYCDNLTIHIRADPAQWRIWQVAEQFFQPVQAQDTNRTVQG